MDAQHYRQSRRFRYDNNCSFMKWTHKNNIVVPDFNHAREMTSDLLDNFMEFKNNLSQLAEGDHGETNGLQIIPV